MSEAVAAKLDKWIADAEDADELAEELFEWFEEADEDEAEEMAVAIAERLMSKAGSDEDASDE